VFTVPNKLLKKIQASRGVKGAGPFVITAGEKGLLKIWDCGASESHCIWSESTPDSQEKYKMLM
jgi:hypothetical protein